MKNSWILNSLKKSALLLLCVAASSSVMAQYTYTTNANNTLTITGYTGSGGAVTIPDSIAGRTVSAIGWEAFKYNYSLTSVTIGATVTTIGAAAFENCDNLTSAVIGKGVTSIQSDSFQFCASLTTVTVDALNPVYSSASGTLFNKNKTALLLCPAGKAGSYTIPSSVTNIGEKAFSYCTRLTSVTIPATVTKIGSMAFFYCTGLTGITIPGSVTTVGDYAFYDCTGLTRITIPSSIKSLVQGMFSECTSLTNATIPTSVTNIAGWAFSGCTSLPRITIPGSVKSIGPSAFSPCSGLISIVIPSSVTNIGERAFDSCTGLTSVTLPGNLTRIDAGVFTWCSALTSLTIPASVTNIGENAFSYCISLRQLSFKGNAPALAGSAFTGDSNLIIYCLPGTTGWGATFGGWPTASWNQTNLVLNPSFEAGGAAPTSWIRGGSAVGSASAAQDGTNSLRIAAAGINASTTQTIAIQAGTTYDISVWIHASGVTAGKAIFDTSDKYDGAGQGQFVISAANAGWKKYSGTFTATNTSVTLRIFTDSTFRGTIYFDNVALSPAIGLPSPWKTQDIGSIGKPGDAAYNNGSYTLKGAGTAINGTSDSFRYVHQISSADCDIKVKVSSLTNTAQIGTAGKSGVMIRETLNSNARAAGVWVTRANTLVFTYRSSTGGTTANISSTGVVGSTAPYWVRLTRTGNTFKAYYGTTGTNWTQIGGAATIGMATNAYLGMGLCSGNTNLLATTVINNVTATP